MADREPTRYERRCAKTCKWCAKGGWLTDAGREHWNPKKRKGHSYEKHPCTAPSIETFAEEGWEILDGIGNLLNDYGDEDLTAKIRHALIDVRNLQGHLGRQNDDLRGTRRALREAEQRVERLTKALMDLRGAVDGIGLEYPYLTACKANADAALADPPPAPEGLDG